MEIKIVKKLINECDTVLDTLPSEQLTTWNLFTSINNIVSKYKNIDCMMSVNFENGNITHGICVITDWDPGALVFQSDNGDLPRMRVVFPEEYISFMKTIGPIFDAQYPEFPKDQA